MWFLYTIWAIKIVNCARALLATGKILEFRSFEKKSPSPNGSELGLPGRLFQGISGPTPVRRHLRQVIFIIQVTWNSYCTHILFQIFKKSALWQVDIGQYQIFVPNHYILKFSIQNQNSSKSFLNIKNVHCSHCPEEVVPATKLIDK